MSIAQLAPTCQFPIIWNVDLINEALCRAPDSEFVGIWDSTEAYRRESQLAIAVYHKRSPLRLDAELYRLAQAYELGTEFEINAAAVRLAQAGAVVLLNQRNCLVVAVPQPRPLRLRRRLIESEVVPGGFYSIDGQSVYYPPSLTRPEIRYGLYETDSTEAVFEVADEPTMNRGSLRLGLVDKIAQAGPVFLDEFIAFVKHLLRLNADVVSAEVRSLAADGLLILHERAGRLAVAARPDIAAMIANGLAAADAARRRGEISPYMWPKKTDGDAQMSFRSEPGRPCVFMIPRGEMVLIEVAG